MDARHNMHRTDSCAEGGFAKASARFGVVTAQGGWRKVTWGVVAGWLPWHRSVIDGAQRRDRRRMD